MLWRRSARILRTIQKRSRTTLRRTVACFSLKLLRDFSLRFAVGFLFMVATRKPFGYRFFRYCLKKDLPTLSNASKVSMQSHLAVNVAKIGASNVQKLRNHKLTNHSETISQC